MHFRRDAWGQLYASAWPPLRGKKKTPLQQEWVDNFKFLASAPKLADGCALSVATDHAKDTGYFWRDVISSALSGKLILNEGSSPSAPPLPFLYREQVAKRYEGVPRVTTPTVNVSRNAYEATTSGVLKVLTPNTKAWDNNAFWSATTNPERLTCQSQGLYLCYLKMSYTPGTSAAFQCNIIDKLGNNVAHNSGGLGNVFPLDVYAFGFFYAQAGDYFRAQCAFGAAGISARIDQFFLLGMTPESVI